MKKKSIFPIIFTVMLAFMVIAAVSIGAGYSGISLAEIKYNKTYPCETGWHTADGTELDIKTLKKINSIAGDDEISIFNTLPADPDAADALFFRTKNVFYGVYIDGEPLYVPDFGESIFYTKSTGTRWTCIDITQELLGKEIEIRVRPAYENARCGIDSFRLGSAGGIILNILSEKLVSFITCVLMLFVGLILIIADIPINIGREKNHELMYLGAFAISVSVWCLVELHIIELFYDDSRLLQMLSCCSLMLVPFALILYLNASVGFKNKVLIPLLLSLCTAGFVISWGLHLLGIKDIHETLTISHVNIVFAAILLVYSIIRTVILRGRNQSGLIYRLMKGIGLCSIAFAAVIDIARYYSGQTNDNAQFVRVGMLIFTVCFGASSLENTINAVKKGAQAEFASKLAYHDGLTGAGNRTAFEERLAELDALKSTDIPVGIVMFDVNDLKYVNDNLGHPVGDSMIITAADIISAAFSDSNDECFRIGGDEFAVIMQGGSVKERFEKSMLTFDELTKQHNSAPDSKFRVSIAHGFYIYSKECEVDHIEDAYKRADEKMYETKRAMKALQSTPEEYYATRGKRLEARG